MPESLVVGSQEHKELFCRFFIDTHVAFDPATIDWPAIDEDSFKRLHSLPVWAEAVAAEQITARIIQTWAPMETDPLIRQAVALQGYEEARHAAIIEGLITYYGIAVPTSPPPPPPPASAEWAFLRLGYSECFDAFFTFALFAIARDAGFFPPVLVEKFEPVMQEEARHILFFVNWEAYRQARRPLWQRPVHLWRGALGRASQVWQRLQSALGARRNKDFTMKGHQALSMEITPRRFLELCLAENAQRLDRYDARLLRPRLVPTMARGLCRVLR